MSDKFRHNVYDPTYHEMIEYGIIGKEKVLDVFDGFQWNKLVEKYILAMKNNEEVFFLPALEFMNETNEYGICIETHPETSHEFEIYFCRPKVVSKFFGVVKHIDKLFTSIRTGQTLGDAREATVALINNNMDALEKRWG